MLRLQRFQMPVECSFEALEGARHAERAALAVHSNRQGNRHYILDVLAAIDEPAALHGKREFLQ